MTTPVTVLELPVPISTSCLLLRYDCPRSVLEIVFP